LVSGNDVPAILSRCTYHLDRASIESAVKELNTLQGPYAELYEPWIQQAKARVSLDQTVNIFSTHIQREISALRSE